MLTDIVVIFMNILQYIFKGRRHNQIQPSLVIATGFQ